MTRTGLILAAVLSTGLPALPQSSPTSQITQVARVTWPGPQTVGILCNYARSEQAVQSLRTELNPGSRILVYDVRTFERIYPACINLGGAKPHYVLLLPSDPFLYDGSQAARRMISHMNRQNVPTLATSVRALNQGAWAVAGPDTGGALLLNPALKHYIEVYGTPMTPGKPVTWDPTTIKGSLTVVSAF